MLIKYDGKAVIFYKEKLGEKKEKTKDSIEIQPTSVSIAATPHWARGGIKKEKIGEKSVFSLFFIPMFLFSFARSERAAMLRVSDEVKEKRKIGLQKKEK